MLQVMEVGKLGGWVGGLMCDMAGLGWKLGHMARMLPAVVFTVVFRLGSLTLLVHECYVYNYQLGRHSPLKTNLND